MEQKDYNNVVCYILFYFWVRFERSTLYKCLNVTYYSWTKEVYTYTMQQYNAVWQTPFSLPIGSNLNKN